MNRYAMAALCLMVSAGAQADRIRPDVEVNVPPEVFSAGGQRAQPCNQCCIYQDQNYSEGAVVRAASVRSRVISAVSIRIKTIPKAQWSGRMACCCSASVMNAPSVQTRWSGVA